MKFNRLPILVLALLLVCANVFATPPAEPGKALSVRTFQFKHKEADKAAAIIKPLMSAEGSISIQPGTNSLVITDKAENLKAVVAALQQYDAPAQPYKLTVRLVAASRVAPEAAPRVTDDLKDVAAKLSMLRFNAFEALGEVNFEGREGEPGLVETDSGYRADFRLGEYDPTSDSLRVSDFRLSKLQGANKDQLMTLLKTSLNLKLGHTVILGASKVPQSQRALMIVVTARR